MEEERAELYKELVEKERTELYKRLNDKNGQEDYIPVIETEKGNYMIWESKVAKCTRESRRRYNSLLESKDSEIKTERFDKLKEAVEVDREKRKGIWFDLEGFINNLELEDIELIKASIKKYS